MTTALITGASGGIGLELAKLHASKKGNLVLVARSQNKLLAIKKNWSKNFQFR
ncbi:MAG TPA: SDR family NAD(P)-dependent oxidoreductase [Chitinophagales bacterium]|nr:SDR family NAD(P)-dependent oxidoreductase [Chitinophagales bacterium]